MSRHHLLITLLTLSLSVWSLTLMIPQVWRSCRHGLTEGLSPMATWLSPLLSVSWVIYGILLHDWRQSLISAGCFFLHIAVLGALLRHQPELRQPAVIIRCLIVPIGLTIFSLSLWSAASTGHLSTVAAGTAIGAALALTNGVAVFPQPALLVREYHRGSEFDASGVAPGRHVMTVLSSGQWLLYGVMMGQPMLCLSSLFSITGAMIVLAYLGKLSRRAAMITQVSLTPVKAPTARFALAA